MKSSIKDKAEGTFHEVKGKVKEVAGKVSDNPEMEAEGIGERIAGRSKENRSGGKSLRKTVRPVLLRTTEWRRLLDLGRRNQPKTGSRL